MLKVIAFSLILSSQLAYSQNLDSRRQNILKIIDEELSEVNRLAKQQNFSSPDTLFRMAELNLEKGRHWLDFENEKYLKLSPEERRSANRSEYFNNSNQFFKRANTAAQTLAKKFPSYRNIGEVYYILGMNYREMGDHKAAQNYLKAALNKTPAKSSVRAKIELTLADYYYNNREYSKAIPLYESSIGKVNDKWWTKDTFNLAWCYYRVKNYNKAIDLMKSVHKRSSQKEYVDLRNDVNRDIGVFFVEGGRLPEAISFYRGQNIDFTKQMIHIAEKTMSDGQFKQADTLLVEALKYEKDPKRKVDILMAQLNLYDKGNAVDKHLIASEELVKLNQNKLLDDDQRKSLTYHVDKKAAELQKSVASKIYANVKKTNDLRAKQAMRYFALSAQLNPKAGPEKIFFQAETAYAANKSKEAIDLYLAAFDGAKEAGQSKIMTQSLEGMLSSLASPSLNKKVADKYYVPVYQRSLSVDQKSPRAKSIYEKLFNAQVEQKDFTGADQTLTLFAKNFPGDFKTQEAMLAKIMEHYRGSKDYDKVKSYVSRINSGEFKVSQKYASALRSLMTKIQIEGVQSSLDKGDKAVALKGYHQIFESSESTPKARANASYNLSALYYELGEANKSYQWSTVALQQMDAGDVVKFSPSFLTIASGLFARQHLDQSADLSYRLMAKTCGVNSANKQNFYKNAIFISLADNELDRVLEMRRNAKTCKLPAAVMEEVDHEILKDLIAHDKWTAAEDLMSELERSKSNYSALILPYESMRKRLISAGNTGEADRVASKQAMFYREALKLKQDIPVEAIDLIALRSMGGVFNASHNIKSSRLSFPENAFNNGLKAKLKALDQLTVQVDQITKTGSGKAIVTSSKVLIDAYESVAEEIKAFTPPDKPQEYVDSFQKAMSEVWGPLMSHARKLRKDVELTINKNSILSDDNFAVLASPGFEEVRFAGTEDNVVMQRGGVK